MGLKSVNPSPPAPWCGSKISPHPCPTTFAEREKPARGETRRGGSSGVEQNCHPYKGQAQRKTIFSFFFFWWARHCILIYRLQHLIGLINIDLSISILYIYIYIYIYLKVYCCYTFTEPHQQPHHSHKTIFTWFGNLPTSTKLQRFTIFREKYKMQQYSFLSKKQY